MLLKLGRLNQLNATEFADVLLEVGDICARLKDHYEVLPGTWELALECRIDQGRYIFLFDVLNVQHATQVVLDRLRKNEIYTDLMRTEEAS